MNARATELLERLQRMSRLHALNPDAIEAMRWVLDQVKAELTADALLRATA